MPTLARGRERHFESFITQPSTHTAISCTPRQQPAPAIRCISRSVFEESRDEGQEVKRLMREAKWVKCSPRVSRFESCRITGIIHTRRSLRERRENRFRAKTTQARITSETFSTIMSSDNGTRVPGMLYTHVRIWWLKLRLCWRLTCEISRHKNAPDVYAKPKFRILGVKNAPAKRLRLFPGCISK